MINNLAESVPETGEAATYCLHDIAKPYAKKYSYTQHISQQVASHLKY
jgi:hypothetical protein